MTDLEKEIYSKLSSDDYRVSNNSISYYIYNYNPLYSYIIENINHLEISDDNYYSKLHILSVPEILFNYIRSNELEINILDTSEDDRILVISDNNRHKLNYYFYKGNPSKKFRIFLRDKKELAKLKLIM